MEEKMATFEEKLKQLVELAKSKKMYWTIRRFSAFSMARY